MAEHESKVQEQSVKEAAEKKAEKDAAAHLDPLRASQLAALYPEPVHYLPDQAEGNPGVQGWVFRPHQEKNPGATPGLRSREDNEFQAELEQQKTARGKQWDVLKRDAEARGETLPERVGPARLRMHVDISAHGVVEEDKLEAVAAAADQLVTAIRAAGMDPIKAGFFGQPF